MKDTQYEEANMQDIEYLNEKVDTIIGFAAQEGVKIDKESKFISITEDEFEEEVKGKKQNYNKQRVRLLLEESYQDILVGIGYAVITIINLFFAIRLVKTAVYLDISSLHFTEPLTQILNFTIVVLTGTLWLYSTTRIWWNFYNKKFLGIYIFMITLLLRVSAVIFMVFYLILMPLIAKLEVTVLMTENLITVLGWTVSIVPTLAIMIFLTLKLLLALRQPDFIKEIESFKIKHYLELKPYSKFDYDIVVVRDLRNGKKVTVRQHDRYIHGCAVGATGTAKTSSVLLPIINQDLNTKARNEDAQKKTIVKFIKKGWAYVEEEFDDAYYSSEVLYTKIKPVPGFEKKFEEEIVNKYKSAGITVIAPDPSLTDNVFDLSLKKGFKKCNRIDPVRNQDGTWKHGTKGFDPLYISPRIPEWSRRKEIIKRATLCADIMQAMFEMSGKSDPYFASVNRIGTLITAIVVMLAHERCYEQKPKLSHIRDIINDFELLRPYLPTLFEINKENNGIYTPIISIVNNEFLGLGRETFEKHAKGLRIQITNFLMNPDIEAILCADNTIDMDEMLEKGEITVINIELGDLGPVDSPAFGLFVTISMINAVLRRSIKGDEWSRLPHFWTIDEFPLIVNPKMESCFTLFRKFRTAMLVAMQTLDQMNKNPFLSYLKGVILNSCGMHIVFGRTNIDDQKTYSVLSGMVDKYVEQKGINETPLSVDDPQYSTRTTFTVEKVARVEEGEMHDRDFQEVTFMRVSDGRPVPAIGGRVDFLKKWDWLELPRYTVDWPKIKNTQPYKSTDQNDGKGIDEQNGNGNGQVISSIPGEGTIYINAKSPASQLAEQSTLAEVNTSVQDAGEETNISKKPLPESNLNPEGLPPRKDARNTGNIDPSALQGSIENQQYNRPRNVNSGRISLGNMEDLVNMTQTNKNENKQNPQKVNTNSAGKQDQLSKNIKGSGLSGKTTVPVDEGGASANENNPGEGQVSEDSSDKNDEKQKDSYKVVEVLDTSKI